MKNISFKSLFSLLCLLCGIIYLCHCSSGVGGNTPSAEIPAPVSHLSISSPDGDGLVRVTADAGFADDSSTVMIANETATSFHFLPHLLLREAWAQANATFTANSDGSFQQLIEAAAGDDIAISYTKDGTQTTVSDSVPENQAPLPTASGLAYKDVAYNPSTNEAVIVANDGTDGFLIFFNLETRESTTVTLTGLSGAARIDIDTENQIAVIADEDDSENIFHYHIPSGNSRTDSISNQVVDVAVSPSGSYAVAALDTTTPSFAFYDIANDIVSADGTATDSTNTSQATALFVDVANTGISDTVALVSESASGSFFLSTHVVDTTTPAFTQQTTVTLSGLGLPGGVVFLNQATEVFITDQTNDLVWNAVTDTGTLTGIEVETNPLGVAVDSAGTKAYVVNAGLRTLSSIDLASLSATRVAALGLSPTEVTVDPTGNIDTIIILNSGDGTLTLFDP